MTIDEAIEIYGIRANTHEREAEYHRPLGYSHEVIANVAEMDAKEERQIAKWLKELKERRAEQTEPQYILREPTDEERQAIIECAKDEPYEYEIKALHKDYVEPYVKISKTEPQTSCKTCRYGEVDEGYVRCAYYSKSTEQTERSE